MESDKYDNETEGVYPNDYESAEGSWRTQQLVPKLDPRKASDECKQAMYRIYCEIMDEFQQPITVDKWNELHIPMIFQHVAEEIYQEGFRYNDWSMVQSIYFNALYTGEEDPYNDKDKEE